MSYSFLHIVTVNLSELQCNGRSSGMDTSGKPRSASFIRAVRGFLGGLMWGLYGDGFPWSDLDGPRLPRPWTWSRAKVGYVQLFLTIYELPPHNHCGSMGAPSWTLVLALQVHTVPPGLFFDIFLWSKTFFFFFLCMYIYMYTYVYIYMCVLICRERERANIEQPHDLAHLCLQIICSPDHWFA